MKSDVVLNEMAHVLKYERESRASASVRERSEFTPRCFRSRNPLFLSFIFSPFPLLAPTPAGDSDLSGYHNALNYIFTTELFPRCNKTSLRHLILLMRYSRSSGTFCISIPTK